MFNWNVCVWGGGGGWGEGLVTFCLHVYLFVGFFLTGNEASFNATF